MVRLTLISLAALVGACGDPAPIARPNLDGVDPQFRPSIATISDMMGFAATQLADPNASTDALRAFALQQLHDAGIHNARVDLKWPSVEPSRGARDYSTFHARFDALAAAGVNTLPILCYGNPWANATSGPDTAPPDDPADFAAFAGASTTAFAGTLPIYEVWNEPNLGFQYWQPTEDAPAYGKLLRASSAAIRAADPSAQIVVGSLLYHGLFGSTPGEEFLEDLYESDPTIWSTFDIFAFHPYPIYPPSSPPEVDNADRGELSLPRMVARMRALLDHYGVTSTMPMWATEVGWPTYGTVDEELQARWLVRSTMLLAGAGIDRIYWYTVFDGPNPTKFPPEDAFGLFHWDDASDGSFAPAPKPAWTALTELLSVAGPLAVSHDVTSELGGAPADAYAYQLSDPSGASPRRVTVVWRTDDSAPAITVTVPVDSAAPLAVIDMLGTPLPASASVSVSGRPIYVIENP